MTKRRTIRVLLADDHFIFRTGVVNILQTEPSIIIIGEACNGKELIEKTMELKPDVILTDIIMPEIDGIEATQKICAGIPGARIIALSMFGEEDMVTDMLEAGALGYLMKEASRDELMNAISTVYDYKPYFSKRITERLIQKIERETRPVEDTALQESFSEREKQIILMSCAEKTSKEIAYTLHISKRTVENHRKRIMNKIGAKSIVGIIVYAMKARLFSKEI
jgi:DNA-binding NarL/FixJ family response regulator